MYAVIFKAEFKLQDQEYSETVKRMRELAKHKYGCVEFISVCEGGERDIYFLLGVGRPNQALETG